MSRLLGALYGQEDRASWRANLEKFPTPALIYFLSSFGGSPIEGLKVKSKEELVFQAFADSIVCNAIENLVMRHSIYLDSKFLDAWDKAFFDLPECNMGCLKIRFYGMVFDEKDNIVAESINKRMTDCWGGATRFCTEKDCIRDKIKSRQNQEIGDCEHAPIWCNAKLRDAGYTSKDWYRLKMFEAGFYVQDFSSAFSAFEPWISRDVNYTCIKCQNHFTVFGIPGIYGIKYINGTAQ